MSQKPKHNQNQRSKGLWIAGGLGALVALALALALLLWWPHGPSDGNPESAAKQPVPPSSAVSPPPSSSGEGPLRRLDPSDKSDLDQAKADAAKLFGQVVGGEAGAVEVGAYPQGFAIELRLTVASLDKERLRSTLTQIYRTFADRFPGPIMQAQVVIFYITGYKNGQPQKERLVTTFMRDKLYGQSWGACPWQSPFYDQSQARAIPCVKEARQ